MNYKTKKYLQIGATVAGVGAVLITGLSVYFSVQSSVRITDQGLFVVRNNTKQVTTGYKYDFTNSYGSAPSAGIPTLVGGELIHLKTEGRFEVREDGTIQPSYQSYQFALADSAVLVFKHKTSNDKFELVFDSDDVDPTIKVPDKNTQNVIERDSSNKRSINNKNIFQALLAQGALTKKVASPDQINASDISAAGDYIITNLGLTVKEGVKWVDATGQPTRFSLSPRDFWYSFMRSKLTDKDYRRAEGGSKELDTLFVKKTSTIDRFKETDRFPNEYLFGFFDLDPTKLYTEKDAIQTRADGRQMFTFSSAAPSRAINGFLAVFEKFLSNSLLFLAAPSQYIDELAANDRLNQNLEGGLEIRGKARQFGTYTYGQTREATLFASPYIPVSAIENREVFDYNPHYADQRFVAEMEGQVQVLDPNTQKPVKPIKKVIFEYSGGIDTSTFNSQLLSSYLKGNVSQVAYASLTPDQRIKIFGTSGDEAKMLEEAKRNGLQYIKVDNISTFIQRTMVQSNPTNAVKSVDEYTFNDQYAELVFGLTRAQLKEGNQNTTASFFVDEGFEFRTLIQAAVNWDAYVKQVYQNQRVMWLNGAAQNAQFSNSTKNDSKPSPLYHYEEVNTLQFVDKTTGTARLISVTPTEMIQHTSDHKNDNKKSLQSPKFDLIKQNMKNLLDGFYAKKNWSSDKKLTWEVVYPYADQNALIVTIMQDIVDVIKLLDPRLNPVLLVPKNAEEMILKIARNLGVSDFNGWGYDYEGIGSYIAAFSNGTGVTILNAFAIFATEPGSITDSTRAARIQQLQTWFPEFTKLSKFVKDKVNAELKRIETELKTVSLSDIYVENWGQITNAQNQDIDAFFKAKTQNKYKVSVHLAKLFREYEEYKASGANQPLQPASWAQLIKELNAIKGVSLDPDNSIPDPRIHGLSLFLREYVVPVTKVGINYFQDYRIEVKK